MRGNRLTIVTAILTALSGLPASAGLIHEENTGRANNAESGCIAPAQIGGSRTGIDACQPGRGDFGGSAKLPISFPQDEGLSLKALGVSSADQIGILFNGAVPSGGTSEDLTLKLYNGRALVLSITGTFTGQTEQLANGKTEYLFNLDSTSVGQLNAAIAGNLGDTLLLESTNASGNSDSYTLVDVSRGAAGLIVTAPDPVVPEPGTIWLLASSLLGLALWKRKLWTRRFRTLPVR
ncbi:MAG TPA: PEP-CTERM sorting domain-containing protein [Bryobacteraceae bacterium]|nr:PEP-CTERM sorting domain-containing protein [Bryobacteraceae bacterium]